ncbi:hypothetical protein ACFL1T_03935 [Chlamydiota bacterium]
MNSFYEKPFFYLAIALSLGVYSGDKTPSILLVCLFFIIAIGILFLFYQKLNSNELWKPIRASLVFFCIGLLLSGYSNYQKQKTVAVCKKSMHSFILGKGVILSYPETYEKGRYTFTLLLKGIYKNGIWKKALMRYKE